jgi:micrococcal nuclease
MRRFVLLVILCLPAICCNTKSEKENIDQQTPTFYNVTKIVDGDTFWIETGTKEEKIRLIGIDAPESRKTGQKEIGYFGKEAKEYLTLLLKGQRVRLAFDVDKKDKYGRTLAYAYSDKGLFINEELVKEGYAVVMTIAPNVKFSEHFAELQQNARRLKKGLWRN